MADQHAKRKSGGKQGRQVVARRSKGSRVRRRRSLGAPSDRGPIKARGGRPSPHGVITRKGTAGPVLGT